MIEICSRQVIAFVCAWILLTANAGAQSVYDAYLNAISMSINSTLQIDPMLQADAGISVENVAVNSTLSEAFYTFLQTNYYIQPIHPMRSAVSFKFDNGVPVKRTESLGPLVANIATTTGKGQFGASLSYNRTNPGYARGLDLADTRLTFIHEDHGYEGLGDLPYEYDTIDFYPNVQLSGSSVALSLNYGLTKNLDIGAIVPWHRMTLRLDAPQAQINSTSLDLRGRASYFFDGSPADPLLATSLESRSMNASGIGDITLRAKHHLFSQVRLSLASILALNLDTGDTANLLGSGSSHVLLGMVSSYQASLSATHLNINYVHKNASDQQNQWNWILAYDRFINDRVTMAVELYGSMKLGSEKNLYGFPEDVEYIALENQSTQTQAHVVSLTNLPKYARDNVYFSSFGMKFRPIKQARILTQVFIPLNRGGLRSNFDLRWGMELDL